MQIEAISAVAASGAAILGIPAALIVGFRQARAAREAVADGAQAASSQWRNNNRRDAVVAFILAVEQALELARAIKPADTPVDLEDAKSMRRELRKTLAVVQLEGPASIAELAEEVQKAVDGTLCAVMAEHRGIAPTLALRAAAARGDEAALALQRRLNGRSSNSSPADAQLWRDVVQAGILTSRQVSILSVRNRARREGRVYAGRPRVPFAGHYQSNRQALENFIMVVRDHLDSPSGAPLSRRLSA
ncbi:hypothetical protein [Actinacidiphila acidipaludis]|uniref:Uncharacterized protein n=1 Tax=Actinacidiphila acidipaludis TaxID=2873382 RepID=A0ABS7Q2V3_9ACTN|nr:hypothetical protein [Streptomyces acidipaludis]MBY8877476.1 hypothetical protein [Streptomyces acidipaludis]